MAQCPVCQTEYVEQVNYCSICGWDLTPYPPTLGQVPSAFLEKEQAKIAWAKEMWAKSQAQSQLEKSEQERSCLQSQLERADAELTLRETALTHIEGQMAQVLSRLQHLVSERSPDVEAALSHLERRLENMEAQLQRARNSLSQWIPNLTLQLAQELAQIPDKSGTRAQIDKLLQSGQLEKLREYLATIGDDNPITQVDALLNARRELKLRGIIKRDIDGDTLYDS